MTQETRKSKIIQDALAGGIPGMLAMSVQVTSLMWLRTTMNYQYKYGVDMSTAMRTLYRHGGIQRFYAGYSAALLQGPLSRFGDTAANAGALSLLSPYPDVPIPVKTMVASLSAAAFRIALMPIDTVKTVAQVEGFSNGMVILKQKVRANGVPVLFHGSMANAAATLAGHYPWYATYNTLNHYFPPTPHEHFHTKVMRSAAIGFFCSLVSDSVSNSLRVVKTARQTSNHSATYAELVKQILKEQGVAGMLGRGLKTRILTNGLQGLMFSVLWRLGQEHYLDVVSKKTQKP